MKVIALLAASLFSTAVFAEHDATYCGKILDGKSGMDSFGGHPSAILAVDSRVMNGGVDFWDEGYASVDGLTEKQLTFVQKAIRSSERRGTRFCVSARWGGAAYSSQDINEISLTTDSVSRIDYQSAFE